MGSSFPRITLSVGRGHAETHASGDLNMLSLGFGMFLGWAFYAFFGAPALFGENPVDPVRIEVFLITASLVYAGCTLAISATNQRFLNFYVGRNTPYLACLLCCAGTAVLFLLIPTGAAYVLAVLSGLLVAIGASLMTALWGTAFARFEFATIILNSAIAVIVGVAFCFMAFNWMSIPVSVAAMICMLLLATLILAKLTPTPYFNRDGIPIFHPLRVRKVPFVARFGLSVVFLGVPLTALRCIVVGRILPTHDLTAQLIVGAAACAALVVTVAAILISHNDSHWGTLMRCLSPFIGAAFLCLPLMGGEYEAFALFVAVAGYICFEIFMWTFFTDLAQEFRLSPIFVCCLGNGIVACCGVIAGVLLPAPADGLSVSVPLAALLAFLVIVGHSLTPRKREIRSLIATDILAAKPGSVTRAETWASALPENQYVSWDDALTGSYKARLAAEEDMTVLPEEDASFASLGPAAPTMTAPAALAARFSLYQVSGAGTPSFQPFYAEGSSTAVAAVQTTGAIGSAQHAGSDGRPSTPVQTQGTPSIARAGSGETAPPASSAGSSADASPSSAKPEPASTAGSALRVDGDTALNATGVDTSDHGESAVQGHAAYGVESASATAMAGTATVLEVAVSTGSEAAMAGTASAGAPLAAGTAADAEISPSDGEAGEEARNSERRFKGRFTARCEEISDRYLLSRRETEVLFLLAKGHNATFIQDKLCISRSTAKTHINHIYRKLDIHTQQELLNMVEQGEKQP